MKTMVLGGTGFLGYFASLELLKRGHKVDVLALDLPNENLFTKEVTIKLADINQINDKDLMNLFSGYDILVYAIGADDRVRPKAPAYEYFYQANVVTTKRVLKSAKEAGVKRAVVCSSYFVYFNKIWPKLEMSKYHPYIRSRVEQEESALKLADKNFIVIILEFGYIFGTMPGRIPLWKPLVNYVDSKLPLFYMKGGTNMISVDRVGEAIAGACEKGNSGQYQIGGENHSWVWMLEKFAEHLGKKKKVRILPTILLKLAMWIVAFREKHSGIEGGLNPKYFSEIQIKDTFIDSSISQAVFGYQTGGLEEAIKDTVERCLK